MTNKQGKAGIRNIAEEPWQQFPDHFGGALSKALVNPENSDIKLIDYRISSYQPMAYVAAHTHKVQEQIYHVLDGEGLMEIDGEKTPKVAGCGCSRLYSCPTEKVRMVVLE